MAIKRQDEVLAKAVASDTSVVPRYDIKRPDGTKVAENVALELKNTVVNEGTAVDKNLLDELLAASGTAGGTASALTLAQDGFVLADGAVVRCKITTDLAPNAALDVNGTGAKYLYTSTGEKFAAGIKAGVWLLLIYSSTLNGYVIVNKTNSLKVKTEVFTSSGTWNCPTGVTSAFVLVYGAGGHGGSGGYRYDDGYYTGAGGGGGGGHMKAQTVTVVPGKAYPVTIGAAGNGSGGATSFGTLLSANGGNAGGSASGGNTGTSYGNGADGGNGGSGGGAGGAGDGSSGKGGTGSHGGNGGDGGRKWSSTPAGSGSNGVSVADIGNGTGGSGGTNSSKGAGGGGGGGGYGGNGQNGGNGNYGGGGGGGGGGYGNYGKGGNGGSGREGGTTGTSGSAGTSGIAIVTYTVEE